jgi:hypothetical protein
VILLEKYWCESPVFFDREERREERERRDPVSRESGIAGAGRGEGECLIRRLKVAAPCCVCRESTKKCIGSLEN